MSDPLDLSDSLHPHDGPNPPQPPEPLGATIASADFPTEGHPPFINRPWVVTEEGRTAHLGALLDCPRCDAYEWPDHIVEQAGRDQR